MPPVQIDGARDRQIGATPSPWLASIHILPAMALTDHAAMVLITGIPGAGKSTVADRLAARFRLGVHVRGDVFRRMVVTGRHEMTSIPSEEAWRQIRLRYRLAAQTADTYYEAGFSVVVQDVAIGPLLTTYVNAIKARPLVLVVLAPRPEVVARREAARTKVAYHDDAATITALDTALRQETPRIGLWIDTSTQSPDQTVDEIIRRGPTEGHLD
jgi:predicted kinase